MMKRFFLLGAAAMMALAASDAQARDRYSERPPVLVSPDLSAPWVMQLRGKAPAYRASGKLRRVEASGQYRAVEPPNRRRASAGAPDPMRTAAVPRQAKRQALPQMDPKYLPQEVAYGGPEKPGTIIIDTTENFLYLVQADGKARRYGVGTGKPGFEWAGTHKITQKREWPDWRPPAEMIAREKAKGRYLPTWLAGGVENPLGARALYLGSTLYRIHGTNQPWTIGGAVSSGCIRMRNEDVIDLYERVSVGTTVKVI
jgi:lipoprotein-anchoring transpeptidase ErfK/SrfK